MTSLRCVGVEPPPTFFTSFKYVRAEAPYLKGLVMSMHPPLKYKPNLTSNTTL